MLDRDGMHSLWGAAGIGVLRLTACNVQHATLLQRSVYIGQLVDSSGVPLTHAAEIELRSAAESLFDVRALPPALLCSALLCSALLCVSCGPCCASALRKCGSAWKTPPGCGTI